MNRNYLIHTRMKQQRYPWRHREWRHDISAIKDFVENTDNVRSLADIANPHNFRESSNGFAKKSGVFTHM